MGQNNNNNVASRPALPPQSLEFNFRLRTLLWKEYIKWEAEMRKSRYIRGYTSSTIYHVVRNKRRRIGTWQEYEALGTPSVELLPDEVVMGMPMADPPKVLVITPTVDRDLRCAVAVGCVYRQTMPDWELVVIKNGSAENLGKYTDRLAEWLRDSRARLIAVFGEGLGLALNAGLEYLDEHDWVWVMEDDDEADPRFLEKMVALGEKEAADLVWCRQKQVPSKLQFDGSEEFSFDNMKRRPQINWPMCIIRAATLKTVLPIDGTAGPATDWDTHLRLLRAGAKFVHLPEVLVTHHWHETNYCLRADAKDLILERVKKGHYNP